MPRQDVAEDTLLAQLNLAQEAAVTAPDPRSTQPR
jgi:hypothetical protein